MNTTEVTYAPHRHEPCIKVQALAFDRRSACFHCFMAAS